jgi:Activator of Hsp90 ATPase homolog 1-like protein
MAKNISLININAPVEKVWEAITAPAFVKQWQYGSDLITTWEVGSDIQFETAWEEQIFKQWGKVLEFNSCKILRYSLFAPRPDLEDKPENYFEMQYLLQSENGLTTLEIIQVDNRVGAKQEVPQGEDNPMLAGLKGMLES